MARILINDGIAPEGQRMLEAAGIEVHNFKIPQDELPSRLPAYNGICVRSATQVRKELISLCPQLKVIGRGGVGLDNIDVEFAQSRKIKVVNTPAASSRSVAELSMAHMLSLSRFLYQSNREMPVRGADEFEKLKKNYTNGIELDGKKLGIIGFGQIGREMASVALGMGMQILPVDPYVNEATIKMGSGLYSTFFSIKTVAFEKMLEESDFISLHIPHIGKPILGEKEFGRMKKGAIIVNCSRGGTVDEAALLHFLNNETIAACGLDVFDNEPHPDSRLLSHARISLSPHIGASTREAQLKVSTELAVKVIEALKGF